MERKEEERNKRAVRMSMKVVALRRANGLTRAKYLQQTELRDQKLGIN